MAFTLTLNQYAVEGIITVLLGIACFFCLIDSPKRGKRWLEPDEIRFLELQMFIKQGGKFQEESGFKMRDLKIVLMNWRLYLQAWFLFCQSATSYGENLEPQHPHQDLPPPQKKRKRKKKKRKGVIAFMLTKLSRHQIHHAHYNQGDGVLDDKRSAHVCPALRCRRHFVHWIRSPV